MAIYLDEDMVGTDAQKIGFPHLVLCMGVAVILADGSLVGAHFTTPATERVLLQQILTTIKQSGQEMRQFYAMAHLGAHVDRSGGLSPAAKARALGFSGPGYVVDFAYLNPTNGTYGEITSNGADARATLRCKLDEHMNYTWGQGGQVMRYGQRAVSGQATGAGMLPRHSTTTAAATDGAGLNTPFILEVAI